MSLTKAKLVEYLHKKMGLPKKDCLQIVETFFEEIMLALEKGEEVKLPGLGNFSVVHKKSRPGRNPRTSAGVRSGPPSVLSSVRCTRSSPRICRVPAGGGCGDAWMPGH